MERRITHHHTTAFVPTPLELAVQTRSLVSHSFFGDHPELLERIAKAAQAELNRIFPQVPVPKKGRKRVSRKSESKR